MATVLDVTPALTVTAGAGTSPTPYYEAVWHEPQPHGPAKPAKQRIGKAWLDLAGRDERGRPQWVKRRGRVPDGFYDERRAHAAAPEAVRRYRDRQAAKHHVATPAEEITVRQLAQEWHQWLQDVRGAAPSTVENYEYMLREPGQKAKRGKHKSHGRIMKRFGNKRAIDVTAKDVSDWLRQLETKEHLKPRNVNAHRTLLHSIYAYGQRIDTYTLPANPVGPTDRRREPPAAHVNYYEAEEVEALARAATQGAHRKPRGRKRPKHKGPKTPAPLSATQRTRQAEEAQLRAAEDRRDAELFRVLFYSGLRLGEIRALRIADITFDPAMNGAMLDVRHAFSAGQEKPPKSWEPRTVAAPRPAAEALARVLDRKHYTSPDDLVFCGRRGQPLSDSALRRRYHAAREAAGLRRVTLHGLRHAAGSILSKGIDQVFAKTSLGHAHVSTTDRYTHDKIDARKIAAVNAAFGVETGVAQA